MTYNTAYGTVDTDTGLKDGWEAPRGEELDSESNVETAGYRTLSQQIKELEDAGKLRQEYLRQQYPNRPTTEELEIE